MTFPESKLAHEYLDGLKGVEIGGSAHNPFGLDTVNVDYTAEMTEWKAQEIELCGKALKVDVVADGDNLPFKDREFDFVLSSHVIEHFWDPIKALVEWKRVAKKYIFIIAPHHLRTDDRDKPLTTLSELIDRHVGEVKQPEGHAPHGHWSVWNTESFIDLCMYLRLNIVSYQDVDDKVGNGFAIVIDLQ